MKKNKIIKPIGRILALIFVLTLINPSFVKASATEVIQYQPVSVTGFNADLVANGNGTPLQTTDNDFDGYGAVLYAQGYTIQGSTTQPSGGLPVDGVINSANLPGANYKLADYSGKNALVLSNTNQSATLTLEAPGAYGSLAILSSSGNGASNFNVTLNFNDNTSITKNLTVPDWYGGDNYAIKGMGRVYRNSPSIDDSPDNPRLYDNLIVIGAENQSKLVKSITFTKTSDTGKACIFGVCGIAPSGVTSKPSALDASLITSTSFQANWESVSGATGYRLDVATDSNFNNIVNGYNNLQVTDTTCNVTGLASNTTYYYRVRATNTSGQSFSSNSISVKTLTTSTQPSGNQYSTGGYDSSAVQPSGFNWTRQSQYLSSANGGLKWSYNIGTWMNAPEAIGSDGTIYVGAGDNHKLYAVKADGTLKWSYATGGNITSSPAIGSDGTIYVSSQDGNLYAIKADGTKEWSYAPGGSLEDSSPAIGEDGTIYVGSKNGNLYAINKNGTVKWNYATGDSIESSPAIASDGTIYVGSSDGNIYAIKAEDGTKEWSCAAGGIGDSSPAIGSDGTIYVGSKDGKLYAINADGTIKWSYAAGNDIESSPAIGKDGNIYVGSGDGKLYAIKAEDGTKKWSYTTGNSIKKSSPILGSDGTVYIGSWDNKLYAINKDGTLKWTYLTNDVIDSSPVIGEDGTIYVGSCDKKLYAIGNISPAINSVSVTPATASVAQGQTKQLTVAVDAVGGAANTVTWSSSNSKVTVGSNGLVTVAADAVPGNYTITATSTVDGTKTGSAIITVTAAIVPPSITTNPSDKTINSGDNTGFTVEATGSRLTYQWQVDKNDGNGFVNVSNNSIYSGATLKTLSITGATTSMSGYKYKVIVGSLDIESVKVSTAATLTVNADQIRITSVKSINSITVDNGTSRGDIDLPDRVDVVLSDSTTTSAQVRWGDATPEYDGDTAGTYVFAGTVGLPDGITNPANLKASVAVNVRSAENGATPLTVNSVESLDNITVDNGTAKSDIDLPDRVDVTLSDSTTTSAAVTWDNGNPKYDGDKAGTYLFRGILRLLDGITNPGNLKASVTVNVRPAENGTTPAAVTVESVESLDDITVNNGTARNDIKLPDTVNVTLSDSTTTSAHIRWEDVNPIYNGYAAGTYVFTGTLILPEGVSNPYDYETKVNVIVKAASSSSSSSSHHHNSSTDTTSTSVTDTTTNNENTNTNANNKGWTQDTNGNWYLVDNGSKATGWKQVDNKWYFFNSNTGAMVTGWYKSESGDWNYDGQDTAGQWFHLDADGKMTTGWLKDTDGNWYYLCDGKEYGALGAMKTGWQKIDNSWYYFNSNGTMASDTVVDGYTVGSDGAWIQQ